jgi:radical SAM protein with 4Fe4S-binding SPASM domain
MPLEVARNAVTGVFKVGKESDFDEIEIDFIGAEPLTAFERLKEISEWIWGRSWCKPHILFATTNGTILTDEMKGWFAQNKKRIYLGLSYDGVAETQDHNRSNSSGAIDLNFFLENWPEQHLKMTITETTVSNLANSIIYLHNRGFRIAANPAHGMNEWNTQNIREYGRQLLKLADYYLENPGVPRASLFSVDLKMILRNRANTANKYCGAGVAYDVIDTDGKWYPCQLFSPLVLPAVKLAGLTEIDFGAVEPFVYHQCKNCILKQICPTCYGLNFRDHGDPAVRETTLCRLFIIQVLANCKYYAKLFLTKNGLTPEERATAYAIKQIYQILGKLKREAI